MHEKGVVVRVNKDKGIGLIRVVDASGALKEGIHFDLAGARFATQYRSGDILWEPPNRRSRNSRRRRIALPTKNAKVILEREFRNGELYARQWAYLPAPASTLAANITLDRRFRVVVLDPRLNLKLTGELEWVDSPESVEPPKIWEGTNIFQLSTLYPLPEEGQPDPLDFAELFEQLYGYKDGFAGHGFFVLDEQLGWIETDEDPRIPLCCVPVGSFKRWRPHTEQPACRHQAAA